MKGRAEVTQKALNNLVTEADIKSEQQIVSLLHKDYPESLFYGEEDESRGALKAPSLWLIDPLDGTNNFAHGIPIYCVSIAYAEMGEVKCGAVYDPERDELFWAQKGAGAFLNGSAIHVTDCDSLQEAIVTTGFYYDRGELMEKTLDSVRRLFRNNIRGIRRTGSAAIDLCWLSCGRFDGYFEYMLSPWDFAAASLILQEAGGRAHDRNGGDFTLDSTGIVASNEKIHNHLLEHVRYS
ncbi:Inositol-1-monophosphatase [Chitinispirillum alkaliphilum]|nr:Inositol-1-monophosphatase [Chitinispirillum alkaliphilum]